MPGAKIPAATKISDTGVHRAEKDAKKGNMSHSIAAVIDNEMNEPVMALDSTKPLRMNMCAIEKQSDA
jgi:hypothetical protein